MPILEQNTLDLSGETLGQIAAADLRKAAILKKHDLDFCCGGKKTLKEACVKNGLDIAAIIQELQRADIDPLARPVPYDEWNLDFLADYIVNTHHSYVKKTLPELLFYAAKVARAHSGRNPELAAIQQLVEEANTELLSHMIKEERVLFPYIKELVLAAGDPQAKLPAALSGNIQNPIAMMELEHESAAKIFEQIRQLSNDLSLPEGACASYSIFYRMLDEFENDLHFHVHLENNILFPKALSIEKKLLS